MKSIDSRKDSNLRQAKPLTPLCYGESFAVVRDVTIRSLIAGLFFSCSPSAILRGIVTVVGDALDAVLGTWRITHVSVEVFKRLPPLTDLNAAPTIVMVRGAARILTSVFHTSPCSPNPRSTQSMEETHLRRSFTPKTPTALSESVNKCFRPYIDDCTADAATFPKNAIVGAIIDAMRCCQSPESLTSNIFKAGHLYE